MLDSRFRQPQGIASQDVVDVRTLLGQHIALRDIGCGALEVGVHFRTVDDELRPPAELTELCRQ